jgi:broad specificity phosphatase PhoE
LPGCTDLELGPPRLTHRETDTVVGVVVTRVVLVRHGESLAQVRKIVGGHRGCEGLSDLGRRQAEALRERLVRTGELRDATALYSSVMPRAIETASIIAPALGALDVVRECDFCESHPGEGDGLSWEEYDGRWPAAATWNPDLPRDPGGETFNEMAARVARALDTIVARHSGELVVVACHGGVIVHTMFRWLGLTPNGAGRAWLNPVNSSLTEWRFGVESPYSKLTSLTELVRFNDHSHVRGV